MERWPKRPGRSAGLSRLGWLGMAVSSAALLALGIFLASLFSDVRERAADRICAENLRLLAYGLLAYVQDQGGYLPPGPAWGDAIFPYVRIEKAYGCPSAPNLGRRAYAYYDRLVDFPLSELADPVGQPVLYDSDLGTLNARDSEVSPVPGGRHHGGNFIAFADGSVNWVPASATFGEPRRKPLPPALPPHRTMSEVAPVLLHTSPTTGASFEYPATWSLTEGGAKVTVASRDSGASIRLTVSLDGASGPEAPEHTGQGFRYNVPLWGVAEFVPAWVSELTGPEEHRVVLVCTHKGRTHRLTIAAPADRWPEVQDIAWSVIESFSLTQ